MLLSFLCVGSVVFSQLTDSLFIKRIADEMLEHGKAYENLHQLTKQIGGRLAGSPAMVKAENWGLKLMKESGADNAWMQECMVPHWVRGGADKAIAYTGKKQKAQTKSLDVLALGNSIGSGPMGVKGDVILVNSFEDLEKRKDEVNGKIVFYNYKFNNSYVNTFLAYRDASQYRGQGPSRAAKYGAKGVIVRSMSHAADNNPHTGSTRYDSMYAKIPAVAIGLKDADWLADEIQKTTNEKSTEGLTVSFVTNGRFLPDTIGHNIIGEIKGSMFPDEIITIGGHLDSWDPAEGAHDDGAGVVHTLEILRTFKALGYQPKRTIRFVLFANEENGLRGGNKYADEALRKKEKHIFALESDAGGFTPRGFSFSGSPAQLQLLQSWVPLLFPYGVYEITDGGGGADIGPLNRTQKTPVSELSPDPQRYFDYHHARNDVFENVNKRELELGAINMAALVYLVDKYGL